MTQSAFLAAAGVEIPAIGIGCNAFGSRIDARQVLEIVDAAIENRVAFFDTADVYGDGASETLLGQAIAGRRDEVIVATKFGMEVTGQESQYRGSAAYVRTAVEASLRRLAVDHIDLYQLHTPDRATPIDDTLEALDDLVQAGMVRAVGCSNVQAWELVDANWRSRVNGWAPFVTAQNEYSMYNRTAEVELVPACEALGVGILPYYPLAYGLLTGKYRPGAAAPAGTRLAEQTDRLRNADWDRIDRLEQWASRNGISMLQLALGGLAAQPAVISVIAGVTSAEQVEANASAGRWRPNAEQAAELLELGQVQMSYTTFAT